MFRPRLRRTVSRTLPALTVLVGAITGMVLLSGSDQPVTAGTYPHWQELAAPALSPRTHALGVPIAHRVLVLGGVRTDWSRARDGASYDLRTGRWQHLLLPVAVTARDRAVAAGRVLVLRHVRPGRTPSWWSLVPRSGAWARMHVPSGLSVPSAFRSEIYAASGRYVRVYSVQLGRWSRLPADALRPALRHRRVTASALGTVVTGRIAGSVVADRWDGLRWHRSWLGTRSPVPSHRLALPAGARRTGATFVPVGGRLVVVSGARAWIHSP